jgi:hypothetical protein
MLVLFSSSRRDLNWGRAYKLCWWPVLPLCKTRKHRFLDDTFRYFLFRNLLIKLSISQQWEVRANFPPHIKMILKNSRTRIIKSEAAFSSDNVPK